MKINVLFTCKGRPELTEICLRRLKDIPFPEDTTLLVAYDGVDEDYLTMLHNACRSANVDWFYIVTNPEKANRFALINKALKNVDADYFIHLENDFYWNDPTCLMSALEAFGKNPELDYIRFEVLPFNVGDFYRFTKVGGHDVCWRSKTGPYRFTLNPHIRTGKFINGVPFFEGPYTKQPEQHFNDSYTGQAACMTGDNMRHLGLHDESGHFKPYYAERFLNIRGRHQITTEEMLQEFNKLTNNLLYRDLFHKYLQGIAR